MKLPPFREVVSFESTPAITGVGGWRVETLRCGHTFHCKQSKPLARRRRCRGCLVIKRPS